jgi:hypothetical protein
MVWNYVEIVLKINLLIKKRGASLLLVLDLKLVPIEWNELNINSVYS